MINLLKEIIETLQEHEKTFEYVKIIKVRDTDINKDIFHNVVGGITYDNGYGFQTIDPSLLIIGDDFILTRIDYDGSEWFEYIKRDYKKNRYELRNPHTIRGLLLMENEDVFNEVNNL